MKSSNPINRGAHLKARQRFKFLALGPRMNTKAIIWQKAYTHSQVWGEKDVSRTIIRKKLPRNNLKKTCKNLLNPCPSAEVKHLN